ncbi:hypothetical protein BJ508DRAFT_315588 [Ascobolus immersus RN42]|uniref:Uncharacterized protein n=1 Tax=Ascobolus immersus RN42 TaxID=1160509 RepID=A0A3N4HA94_ASCIM|nr:hypothetical protein BJ508DRAFT_315588 [Ascobolus immersus RN42]
MPQVASRSFVGTSVTSSFINSRTKPTANHQDSNLEFSMSADINTSPASTSVYRAQKRIRTNRNHAYQQELSSTSLKPSDTGFRRLPCEIRLLIAEDITNWQDHMAFRQADRTNHKILTDTRKVRNQFRLPQDEDLRLQLDTFRIQVRSGSRFKLLIFLLKESGILSTNWLARRAFQLERRGAARYTTINDQKKHDLEEPETEDWLTFVHRNNCYDLCKILLLTTKDSLSRVGHIHHRQRYINLFYDENTTLLLDGIHNSRLYKVLPHLRTDISRIVGICNKAINYHNTGIYLYHFDLHTLGLRAYVAKETEAIVRKLAAATFLAVSECFDEIKLLEKWAAQLLLNIRSIWHIYGRFKGRFKGRNHHLHRRFSG